MFETLRINPDLPLAELSATLAAQRRVQVHDFLEPDSAQQLRRMIDRNGNWYLSFNRGAENLEVPLTNLSGAPEEQRREFLRRVHDRARRQFQYLFVQYYITEMRGQPEHAGNPLNDIHDFFNDAQTLDFFRALTGEAGVSDADVLASRYEPGHFLTRHDDSHGRRDRLVAYVLNLTPEWNPDWGGHLAFFDDQGNITQAFVPDFNTLNVFLVPQMHAVQSVAPFAGAVRTSLTGWIHRRADATAGGPGV